MLMGQIVTPAWTSTFSNLHTNANTANVGIGTPFPACRLEIWKSSANTNYPDIPCLGLFNQNSSGSKAEIAFGNGDPEATPSPVINPYWSIGIDPNNNGTKDFYTYCVKNQKFPIYIKDAASTSSTTNLIGINNNNPQTELDLTGRLWIQNPVNPTAGKLDLQFNSANANIDAHGGGLLLNWYTDNLVRVGQYNANLFVSGKTFSQQGVGIGAGISTLDAQLHIESNDPSGTGRVMSVTSPGSLGRVFSLYADGRIYCRRVQVMPNTVPDYVFNPDYKLMPLNDLQNYVQTHRHLPNVPSEKEIQEKGSVDLNEMQMKLLEKVEELTLYILQQQKETEQLKQQLKGEK
jgi:hypothetical protein